LGKLDRAFAWETRVFYLVPVGTVLFFISANAAYVFLGVFAVYLLIMDGLFSVIVARAFLRPILQALRTERPIGGLQATRGIERTKWTTFAGVALAVATSSLLYVNIILWAAMRDTFSPSPWLNPFVFMSNVDSMLNDFAMLLASGLLASPSKRRNIATPKRRNMSIAPTIRRSSADLSDAVMVARSQLETASAIPNTTDVFVPPQAQARCLVLQKVAATLQEELFQRGPDSANAPRILDESIMAVIENEFVTTARIFFLQCVDEGRQLVTEMRDTYHRVRLGHLVRFSTILGIIRVETIFPTLQQVSEELVRKCAKLERPRKQSSTMVSGVYISGEAVSKRYNKLMSSLASMTGAKFHKAPLKGLVRMVEKLTLATGDKKGKPELLCDIVRGSLECRDFQTMISAVQLLQELDPGLCDAGATGGIQERICICRAKNRFGQPTSGGWADFMVNFHFKEDGHKHICEVQFAHSQMLLVRQKMGGHKIYGQFRGAMEMLEVLGLNPEDGIDAKTAGILKDLAWTGQPRQGRTGSRDTSLAADPTGGIEVLQAKLETLNTDVSNLVTMMDVQAEMWASRLTAKDVQVERLEAKVDAQAKILQLVMAKLDEGAAVKVDELQRAMGSSVRVEAL
jgi:hypothetical protein